MNIMKLSALLMHFMIIYMLMKTTLNLTGKELISISPVLIKNAASIASNRKEAIHGIAIAMASTINMPKKGKKLNLTISVGKYQEAKAISISGSAKINKHTDVFFGIGRTNDRKYTASKVGASFDW